MFPSEITPLVDSVGLAVCETVLWLYVGSAEAAVDAGAVDPAAVEGVGDAGEPGPVGPPEGDSPVCDETAELSAPEEQAVVSEAHRIAITAATRGPRRMRARRTIGGAGGVRTGRVRPQISSIVLPMTDPP